MERTTFILLLLITTSISGSLTATGFGTTVFRKTTTKAPIAEGICPSGTTLTDGRCVLNKLICDKGKTWSIDENKCVCPEKDAEYNNDLLLCIKGGVWTPTFDNKIPVNAFPLTNISETMKLHPVKIRKDGNDVIGKLNSEYGIVTYDVEGVHLGNNYDEIFTSTDLKVKGNYVSRAPKSYLTFRVKGNREVSIAFVSQKQCFSISIGVITNHFIGIHNCLEQFASTVYVKEDLLRSSHSRGFWVFWNSSSILMGLEGDLKPRIQLKEKKIDPFTTIKYLASENTEWQVPLT